MWISLTIIHFTIIHISFRRVQWLPTCTTKAVIYIRCKYTMVISKYISWTVIHIILYASGIDEDEILKYFKFVNPTERAICIPDLNLRLLTWPHTYLDAKNIFYSPVLIQKEKGFITKTSVRVNLFASNMKQEAAILFYDLFYNFFIDHSGCSTWNNLFKREFVVMVLQTGPLFFGLV